jgi:hypothetical protein
MMVTMFADHISESIMNDSPVKHGQQQPIEIREKSAWKLSEWFNHQESIGESQLIEVMTKTSLSDSFLLYAS